MSYRIPQVHYWQSKDGRWRFALVGANGEPQAASQGYVTRHGCLSGIVAAKRNWRRAVAREVAAAPSSL